MNLKEQALTKLQSVLLEYEQAIEDSVKAVEEVISVGIVNGSSEKSWIEDNAIQLEGNAVIKLERNVGFFETPFKLNIPEGYALQLLPTKVLENVLFLNTLFVGSGALSLSYVNVGREEVELDVLPFILIKTYKAKDS